MFIFNYVSNQRQIIFGQYPLFYSNFKHTSALLMSWHIGLLTFGADFCCFFLYCIMQLFAVSRSPTSSSVCHVFSVRHALNCAEFTVTIWSWFMYHYTPNICAYTHTRTQSLAALTLLGWKSCFIGFIDNVSLIDHIRSNALLHNISWVLFFYFSAFVSTC